MNDILWLYSMQVAFGYSPDKVLYRNVDLGVDLDSRVAIVGPNGAGKVRKFAFTAAFIGHDLWIYFIFTRGASR